MSYAQRRQMSSNRTVAIIIVALIHLILGYAIVTGLAYNVMKKAAEDLNKRPAKRRAIIVLSDGADTSSRRSADYALKTAQNVDAIIYTVDMSAMDGGRQMQNIGVLKNFAEKTGGRFVATPGGAQMRQAFEQIVAELGTQYTIAYDPKNTAQDGKWRTIELRVARKNLYIRTRKGYHAPKLQKPVRQRA